MGDGADEVMKGGAEDEYSMLGSLGSTTGPVLVASEPPVVTVWKSPTVVTNATATPEGTVKVPSPDEQSQCPLATSEGQHQRLLPHGVSAAP